MADKKKGRWKKRIILAGVGFIGLLALGFGGLYFTASSNLAQKHEFEVAAVEISEGDEHAIERGEYLVNHVMGCAHSDCHQSDMGGGAVMDVMPVGRVYAPNLTAGEGSVVKDYTPEDWVRVIRHGLKPDGTRALIMPSEDYWVFPDSDIAAVIAYTKSLPAVDRESPGHSLGPVGLIIVATKPVFAWDKIDHNAERPKAEPGPTPEWGEVMAGSCKGCHGGTFSGGMIPGADPSWPEARNITLHETGIKGWEFEDFDKVMRTGERPDGTKLHESMPYMLYAGMTDDDVKALWLYLKTVEPKAAGGR